MLYDAPLWSVVEMVTFSVIEAPLGPVTFGVERFRVEPLLTDAHDGPLVMLSEKESPALSSNQPDISIDPLVCRGISTVLGLASGIGAFLIQNGCRLRCRNDLVRKVALRGKIVML
jgi:hypothetical protein